MTKAAAIIALIVTLIAAGYLVYESTAVRDAYKASILACMSCTTAKQAAEANWRWVESSIELLKAKGQYREAEKFAKDHAGERPVNTDVPCSDCGAIVPNYTTPGAVAVVGLIVSLVLFGAAKPKK